MKRQGIFLPLDLTDRFLPLLVRVQSGETLDVADKRYLGALIKEFEGQSKLEQDQKAAAQNKAESIAELRSLANVVGNVLPRLRKTGLTEGAVVYIKTVSVIFQNTEAAVQKCIRELLNEPQGSPVSNASNSLPVSLLRKYLDPAKQELESATEKYLASDPSVLVANADFNLATKRQSLAQKCFRSAIVQVNIASTSDTLDELSSYFYCMCDHIVLADALIGGKIGEIEHAYGMPFTSEAFLVSEVKKFSNELDDVYRLRPSKPVSKSKSKTLGLRMK